MAHSVGQNIHSVLHMDSEMWGSEVAMKEKGAGCADFANHQSQQTLCIKCFIRSMVHLQGIMKTELELFV